VPELVKVGPAVPELLVGPAVPELLVDEATDELEVDVEFFGTGKTGLKSGNTFVQSISSLILFTPSKLRRVYALE
jgi:hypothetical protein